MSKPDYETTLAMLSEARQDELLMKKTLRAELWAEYDRRLKSARQRVSRLANQAVEQGASLASVGRAYGTSNFVTVKKLIELTEAEHAAERETEALAVATESNYTWDAESHTMTIRKWEDVKGQSQRGEVTVPSTWRGWIGGIEMWVPSHYPDGIPASLVNDYFLEVNRYDPNAASQSEPEPVDEFAAGVWATEDESESDPDDYWKESE